jgi:outer membrane immunogenic protein
MTKHIWSGFIAAAAIVLASSANAADIRPAYKAAPVMPATYSWTGFYIGGHVGYGWGETNATPTGIVGLLATPFSFDHDGFMGGGTIGFNYQYGNIVIGTEADISWSDVSGSGNSVFLFGLIPGASAGGSVQNNWVATVSTRLGVAFDRLLVYGKAGVAYADNDYTANAVIPGVLNYRSTISETETGWLIGGGVEWAFADNWTAKIEGTYMDFGQKNRAFTGIPIGGVLTLPVNADIDSHISTVKFGVNYKFGGYGKSPVMAKY